MTARLARKGKGKPLKQGGALAKFNDWFGSVSLMNTLYVWFPASLVNPVEVQNGTASRNMRYEMQKWNVNFKKVHPILVANARVDWMSLEDSDITQQFEILRQGILRDVTYSLGVTTNAAAKAHSVAPAALHGQQGWWMAGLHAASTAILANYDYSPCLTGPHWDVDFPAWAGRLMQSKHLWTPSALTGAARLEVYTTGLVSVQGCGVQLAKLLESFLKFVQIRYVRRSIFTAEVRVGVRTFTAWFGRAWSKWSNHSVDQTVETAEPGWVAGGFSKCWSTKSRFCA